MTMTEDHKDELLKEGMMNKILRQKQATWRPSAEQKKNQGARESIFTTREHYKTQLNPVNFTLRSYRITAKE